MPAPASDQKFQRRKEERPSEIMAAGLKIFAEKGFAATKLEEVAEAAGVSKATIYLYFDSKTDLFTAIARDIATPRLDDIEKLLDAYEGSSADLLDFVMAKLKDITTGTALPSLAKIILAESANFPEIREFYRDHIVLRGTANLSRVIERGIERGEFRNCNVNAAVQEIIFPILMNTLARNTFGELPLFDPDGFFTAHAEFVARGLAADREA
ncbi:TetR/AcrR family transcriptional regulator [Parvibaculum sp.]|jgi:AcrR family transcriptional regulator|uniref:TetR/AcrR family transcriptional regulator n=1 Tax=Parvibaculum sp. TaxID=2024848 RepID=UPI00329A2CCC